ncbi:MAG: DUF4465 domain-containing protein [Chitinophagales bacterium]
MRTITLLFSALALGATVHAQTVATFEDLTLSKHDTSYISYYDPGADVGFNDGLAHFPCIYDTAGGNYWASGFSYSNWTDSVTSGYTNQYSAKTAIGYGGSANYAVAWCSNPVTFANTINLKLNGTAIGHMVSGFYVTNNTYAYNSMRDGDFAAKKFGGASGNDPDWFLLTMKGYSGGVLTADSVNFYLADYRFVHNDSDYIVKTWEWVNLTSLGHVDSLQFLLSSSDNGSFGMNTPAYFCMDNFTTNETSLSVGNVHPVSIAKVYPNPATDMLYVDVADNSVQQIIVTDLIGKIMGNYRVTEKQVAINTASLPSGVYILELTGKGKTANVRFVKK